MKVKGLWVQFWEDLMIKTTWKAYESTIILGNWIAGFKGFNLWVKLTATAVFQVLLMSKKSWLVKIEPCQRNMKNYLSLTVDGRNPAPVDMISISIPLFTRFYTSQVVQDVFRSINSTI